MSQERDSKKIPQEERNFLIIAEICVAILLEDVVAPVKICLVLHFAKVVAVEWLGYQQHPARILIFWVALYGYLLLEIV